MWIAWFGAKSLYFFSMQDDGRVRHAGNGCRNNVCSPAEAKMKSEYCQPWTKYTHIQSSSPLSITWGVLQLFCANCSSCRSTSRLVPWATRQLISKKMGIPNPVHDQIMSQTRRTYSNILSVFSLISTAIQYAHHCPFPRPNWTFEPLCVPHTTSNSPVDLISWNKQSFTPPGFWWSWLVGSNIGLILVPRSSVWWHIWYYYECRVFLSRGK